MFLHAGARNNIKQLALSVLNYESQHSAWRPVDFHLLAVPQEPGQSTTLFPLYNHDVTDGTLPGQPNAGPFDRVVAEPVAGDVPEENYRFSAEEIGRSLDPLYFGWSIVPSEGTDPALIRNEVFDIDVSAELFLQDESIRQERFAISSLPGSDGPSNVGVYLPNLSRSLRPDEGDPLGLYSWVITVRDQQGGNWGMNLSFQVVPEPVTLVNIAIPAFAIVAGRNRKQRSASKKLSSRNPTL